MRRAAALVAALALGWPAAAAAGSVALPPALQGPSARLTVGPDGVAAVLAPSPEGVVLLVALPGARPEAAALPRRTLVVGLALLPGGRPVIVTRSGPGCAPLVAMSRDGGWRRESLGRATAAALAQDPDGGVGVLAAGCDGGLILHRTDDAAAAWTQDPLPLAAAGAPLSLALGPDGVALAAAGGRRPVLALRAAAGEWRALPLPAGPVARDEAPPTLAAGLDPLARPVVLIVRGQRAAEASGPDRIPTRRVAFRLVDEAWSPIGAGGAEQVRLASAGLAMALLDRRGGLAVESPAGDLRVRLAATDVAVGADGTPAWLDRDRPGVLGVGPPPALEISGPATADWGARVRYEARLSGAEGPLAGVRLRMAGAGGRTDGMGRMATVLRATRSLSVEASVAAPGPVAPASARRSLRVRPRPSRIAWRIAREGGLVVVRGHTAGGAALPGGLGRVHLIDLAGGRRRFLPGRPIDSAPGGRPFRLRAPARAGGRLALFYEGRSVPLGVDVRSGARRP